MTVAEDLATAVAELGTDAQAAADRVTAAVGDLRTQLADSKKALADYIETHPDETGLIQSALDGINNADAIVDSIQAPEPEPVPEPAPEEPPVV